MSRYNDLLKEADLGGGKYLSLNKKDDEVFIRIASEPKFVHKHWLEMSDGKKSTVLCGGENCEYCGKSVLPKDKVKKTAQFAWFVFDRNDGDQLKIFKGPISITAKLAKLDDEADWGDPTGYDIRIKRTEEPGSDYYTVIPVPKNMRPLTDEEKQIVAETSLDLKEELERGMVKNESMETAPDDLSGLPESPNKSLADEVADDIPF